MKNQLAQRIQAFMKQYDVAEFSAEEFGRTYATKFSQALAEQLLQSASLGNEAQLSEPLVLTLEQIKELARFAEEEGQPSYTITTGTIPAFEAEDGEMVAEYNGLIAYSDSEKHSVLQLE